MYDENGRIITREEQYKGIINLCKKVGEEDKIREEMDLADYYEYERLQRVVRYQGISDMDAQMQLVKRCKSYNEFLVYDSDNRWRYSEKEYQRLGDLFCTKFKIRFGKDYNRQYFIFQFPNKYGATVERNEHTNKRWYVRLVRLETVIEEPEERTIFQKLGLKVDKSKPKEEVLSYGDSSRWGDYKTFVEVEQCLELFKSFPIEVTESAEKPSVIDRISNAIKEKTKF